MAIKIEMLRCFDAVVRKGSLSEAAAMLGRTPSAISMMLKQFEDHIGAPLFETARKTRLTQLGELIHAEASRELRHFDSTVTVIEGLSRSKLGFLRMVVTPSMASAFMPGIIKTFVARYPDVQIDLRDLDSESIAAELRNDRAEIGIGSLPDVAGFTKEPLFRDRFGVLCASDHPLARSGEPASWREVAKYPFIANGLCSFVTDRAFQPILAESRLMVRNTVSLYGLLRAGVGISLLPRLVVDERTADLTFVPLVNSDSVREVSMLTRPSEMLTPAARHMVEEIKAARAIMTADPATE